MNVVTLILALVQGAASLLEAQSNKTAQQVGTTAADIDAVAVAVLQASAAAKGQAIDWTNPAEVAAYVSSLPGFTPLAASPAAPAPIPAPPAAS
jgi:hypothetical protein